MTKPITLKAHLRKMCNENSPWCNQWCYLFWFFCAWNNANAWQFFVPQFMFKKARQNNNNKLPLFFFTFLEVIESVSFCCEKAKYIKNYGWRQNVFILHVPEDIAYKARMIIILWGGTGEVEAVKNVVALYRIYLT